MHLKIKVQVVLRDKNGKVTKTINKPCHSYVIGMIDMLYGLFSAINASTTHSITDTEGTSRAFNFGFYNNANSVYFMLVANSPAGDNSYGIQVGTGSNAILITDNCLKTLILHGDTATKLSYGATSIGIPATVGTSRTFTMARTLTNDSGADIIVNEIGLVILNYFGTTLGKFLIEHSLLTFTVANLTSGTVTYTISVTA